MTTMGKINLKIGAILTEWLQSETVVVSLREEIISGMPPSGSQSQQPFFGLEIKMIQNKDDQYSHFQENQKHFIDE